MKNTCLWYIVFPVLKVILIKKIQNGAPTTPSFSGAKGKIFLHNIGVDKREGVDKKKKKKNRKEGAKPKSDIPYSNSTITFFFNSIFPSWFLIKL